MNPRDCFLFMQIRELERMQEEEFNRKDYYAILGLSRNVEFSFIV